MGERVKWGRSSRSKYDDVVYHSKCGRFRIERREYIMPYTCVGYYLIYREAGMTSDREAECSSLRDAKAAAEEMFEPNSGYTPVRLDGT